METILIILGGLGLFLFAITNPVGCTPGFVGREGKRLLGNFIHNVFSAIITGLIITVILDSSSAVIIMAIVLVNARFLTFRQAIGIVLGANAGTTFSSQIIALDVGKFSPIPVVIRLLLLFLPKQNGYPVRPGGSFTMERAVEPLRDHPTFLSWMTRLENPISGAGTGGLVTLIIQSSSATVGMVITLGKKSLITLPAAIAVMMVRNWAPALTPSRPLSGPTGKH